MKVIKSHRKQSNRLISPFAFVVVVAVVVRIPLSAVYSHFISAVVVVAASLTAQHTHTHTWARTNKIQFAPLIKQQLDKEKREREICCNTRCVRSQFARQHKRQQNVYCRTCIMHNAIGQLSQLSAR